SNYKVTLKDSVNEKYASLYKELITFNVGGNYNVYINRKTYQVNLELINANTATYSCVYYDGENFNELAPYDASVPYIFYQQYVVSKQYTYSVPNFHTNKYKTYSLSVVDTNNLLISNKYFKNIGTYNLIVNLKDFTITVELVPE
ncbi:MAG: hypothetical protein J6C97_00670, partial [Clostridia bacterium]|nr:hypothetical protein [Clostridia bacterium]